MRVRLWAPWPAPDGSTVHPAGAEIECSGDEGHALAAAGRAEILEDGPERAVTTPPERAVSRRQRRKARA